jgi:Recombination endonuclease VII
MSKKCYRCKRSKNIKMFRSHSAKKDGRYHYCRLCEKKAKAKKLSIPEYYRLYLKRRRDRHDPEKGRIQRLKLKLLDPNKYRRDKERRRLKSHYGITPAELRWMKRVQMNRCAICGLKKVLVVDHCHVTRRVRGLLCFNCNSAIAFLGDSIKNLKSAIKYLSRRFSIVL